MSDEPSNEVRKAILAEIVEILTVDDIGENEFTIRHFMEHTQIPRRTAAAKLEQLVDRGILTKRIGNVDGASCNIYGKAEV